MPAETRIKEFLVRNQLVALFFISVFLWVFSFRRFLSGELALFDDAQPYYRHFRYLIENFCAGIYPVWDPTLNCGIPAEFFLRRIGSFNPFFSFLAVFQKAGFYFIPTYLAFLASYFVLGAAGFYFLARRIFKNTLTAFIAYLLLLFSSLGTRIFDSYIVLSFVPMVWFFYFLIAFAQAPRRHFLIGLTFSLMIIAVTYIPFYFVVIFAAFLLCFVPVYFENLQAIFSRCLDFMRKEKILACLCTCCLLISMLPGILFFIQSGKGELVIPLRHGVSSVKNAVAVDVENITKWAIPEDVVFSGFFLEDLTKFKFAVFYLPLFVYILFVLGIFTPVKRKMLFFTGWSLLILFIGSPNLSPLYNFLYEHIFFFKLFRNLHFFLWFHLLPVFILLVAERTEVLLDTLPREPRQKIRMYVFFVLVHAGFMIFLYNQGRAVSSSYLTVILSFLFFSFCLWGWPKPFRDGGHVFLFVMLITVIQPLEVYSYLGNNVKKYTGYSFDRSFKNFYFMRDEEREKLAKEEGVLVQALEDEKAPDVYVSTYWYNELLKNVSFRALAFYVRHKFILYDRVQVMDPDNADFKKVEIIFKKNLNLAMVASDGPAGIPGSDAEGPFPVRAELIRGNSANFKVVDYDTNSIKIVTDFKQPKFMVYTDSFHSGWRAFINRQSVPLYRANIAFKGVWVPAGPSTVYLKFGDQFLYVLNYFFLFVFYSAFGYLLFSTGRYYWQQRKALVQESSHD